MKRSIGVVLVSGACAIAVLSAIGPAFAASQAPTMQSSATKGATHVSARRDNRHRFRYDSYRPYDRPYYYARPTYYRPYPYAVPLPFLFGIGFGPPW
jgi:hypothetical protein